MTDDALDMSHEGLTPPPELTPPPADPWLARRLLTWGASEVAALMVGLGRVSDEGMAKHVLSSAKHVKRRGLSCECCDGSATHIAGIDGWRLCADCDVCGVCDQPAQSGLCVDCAATRPGLAMNGGEW